MKISSCAHSKIRGFAPQLRRPNCARTYHGRPHSSHQQHHSGFGRRSILQSILHTGSAMLAAASLQTGGFVSMAAAAESKAAKVLIDPQWPEELPFQPDDFERYDESKDTLFYSQPRFVTHIDDQAIAAITSYYEETLPKSGSQDVAILDMCSSWVSHYPSGYKAGRIAGLGMNNDELEKNPVLTEYAVRDLNVDPSLPYEDNSFDVITNVVSVDYLNKPIKVFKEMHRVLKPNGRAIMSFSNRCFPTKAIAIWTRTADLDHVWIVGAYFHYSVPGGWSQPEGADISPKAGLFGKSDPMYVVTATKV